MIFYGFFTYKWKEYIEINWGVYVNSFAFFSFKNSVEIKKCDDDYDEILIKEFNKYYNAKKKYVSMYSEFEEKLGTYQEVELKTYEEELEEYKKRVDLFSKELRQAIHNVVDEDYFMQLKNIDFKLLLLGYVSSSNYEIIIKRFDRVFNKANAFLLGYSDYYEYLEPFVDSKLLDISFHDSTILEVVKDENNLKIILEDGYYPYDNIYYLTLKNVLKHELEKMEIPTCVLGNSIYYNNGMYYFYIDDGSYQVHEFICSEIELDIVKK